jgi:hypothetical protein
LLNQRCTAAASSIRKSRIEQEGVWDIPRF